MKVLINVSNHPSNKWGDEQKKGWDVIVDFPFPAVDPHLDTNDKGYINLVRGVIRDIERMLEELEESYGDIEVYLYIAGEFSLSYKLYEYFRYTWNFPIAIPTTERRVVEKEDGGKTVKESIFEFIRWRII